MRVQIGVSSAHGFLGNKEKLRKREDRYKAQYSPISVGNGCRHAKAGKERDDIHREMCRSFRGVYHRNFIASRKNTEESKGDNTQNNVCKED